MSARVEQLFQLLPANASEFAIILLDEQGHVLFWSAGAERIFGIHCGDIVGQPTSVLFTQEDVARGIPDLELSIARTEGNAENDRWMSRGDGSRFWATGVMLALRDKSGTFHGFAKILRNRTDLKELTETLRLQAEAATALNRRKDVFLSTLSHELRNPLAPLTQATEILRIAAPQTPEVLETLKMIDRQVDSLRRLVDDLMDVTRISVGKVELNKQVIPVQDVVLRSLESARPALRERNHEVTVLMAPSPIRVEADPSRLEQVFLNLIHNAAKYTPENGRITVKASADGHEAVVHVEDNGIGIPHDMLPRIFDLFTQVEASRQRSQGGLGIGLSLVKELASLHGGSVQVRSDGPGTGSEFTVRIPLAKEEPTNP